MSSPTTFSETPAAALVTFDDGKANVFNADTVAALGAALDRAEASAARAVVVTGRPGLFSAGLDLRRLPALDPATQLADLTAYFELMVRMFLFPKPLVVAASGHALAGGCVMLLTGDVRLGAAGPFQVGLNEVRIGIPLPAVILELGRAVLPVASHVPAMLHGTIYTPDGALAAGLFHEVVPADALLARAMAHADALGAVDTHAYARSKRRLRGPLMEGGVARFKDELAAGFFPAR